MSATIKLLVTFYWFVLAVTLNSAVAYPQHAILGLFEGNNCRLPSGAHGVCTKLKDCPAELNRLRSRQRAPVRTLPVICSFSSSRPDAAPVVCCEKTGNNKPQGTAGAAGNRPPPTPQPRPQTTPPGPPLGRPTRTPPSVALGTRLDLVGAKAKKACDDLSNEVRPSIIPLIHGGANTIKGEFPHMALLGYRSVDNTAILWNCGGALISRRYVLTAAHCIIIRTRNHGPAVRVRLGEFDLRRNNDGELDFGIEKATAHPDYKANAWYNDIALVRLDKDVKYSTNILPACLYTESEDPMGGLVITGWGATTSTGDVKSSILQKGNRSLDLVPASTCESIYFSQGARNRLSLGVNSGMFCAVDPAAIVDTCQGDSGGPIQVEKNIGHATINVIVGVTSVGPSLCGGSTPAIYTRVYNYLSWIESVVWP